MRLCCVSVFFFPLAVTQYLFIGDMCLSEKFVKHPLWGSGMKKSQQQRLGPKNTRIRNIEVYRVNSMLFMFFFLRSILLSQSSRVFFCCNASAILFDSFWLFFWLLRTPVHFNLKRLHWNCFWLKCRIKLCFHSRKQKLTAKDAVLRSLWTEVTGYEGANFSARLNPTQPGKSLKIGPKVLDFWLLQFAETMWKSTSTFWWNEWALPKKRRQRGMDFTSGWNSHFISTLDETLVKKFGISSGKGTYPMEIILSPELHVCFFQSNLFNRQIPESVNCFLICECVSRMRFTSLKINGCEPENHLFEKQDHLPSTSARVYPRKIPPWTKKNRQILVRTKMGAPTCWSNLRHKPRGCDAMYGVYMDAWKVRSRWINSIHECLGDRWHRKIGVSWC